MTRAESTWLVLLPLNKIAGIHAIQQEAVRCVALAVGPDGRVAQAGVGARAARQLRVNAGGKDRQSGESCRWAADVRSICWVSIT